MELEQVTQGTPRLLFHRCGGSSYRRNGRLAALTETKCLLAVAEVRARDLAEAILTTERSDGMSDW